MGRAPHADKMFSPVFLGISLLHKTFAMFHQATEKPAAILVDVIVPLALED